MANFFSNIFSPNTKPPKVSPYKEAGVGGAHIVGGWLVDREKNQKLTYLQRSTKYEELMSNIAVVGAGVRYFTALGASAVWSVKPSEDDKSEEYADFVRKMMEQDLSQSWSNVVKQALMYRYLGFSLAEAIAGKTEDGYATIIGIENRPIRTIEQFDVDENGTLRGFGQRDPNTGQTLYIPRNKCLYVVDNLIDDSPAGMGVLRHVFESCERLQKLLNYEVMGYAKDLRNIPVGRIPYTELNQAVENGEITKEQAQAAISAMENIVRMKSKLPETGLVLDSKTYMNRSDTGVAATANKQWDLELLEGSASNGLADIGKAIERIQAEIARVLSSEQQMLSGGGSLALSKDKSANAYLAVNAAIGDVVDAANKDIIPFIWQLNGWDKKYAPKFSAEDVSDKDAQSVAAVLKDIATAGAPLSPDDEVLNDLRSMLGVAPIDLEKAAAQMLEEQQMQQQQARRLPGVTT